MVSVAVDVSRDLNQGWSELVKNIESLDFKDNDFHSMDQLQTLCKEQRFANKVPINFNTPSFKTYQTSEITPSPDVSWPAISVTGDRCKLNCEHCQAKILSPMDATLTPSALSIRINQAIADGAPGMLLSGGSNHQNEVEYEAFWPIIRRIKDSHPNFIIACHTALVDDNRAQAMQQAGVDVAMMDIIGSQQTITHVYHLKRSVSDFEASLAALNRTSMRIVPHIVVGLHFGSLLGEWRALDIITRNLPSAVVLVVATPIYSSQKRPFATPDPHEVGEFFLDARLSLANTQLMLGCARPPGKVKQLIDTYAVLLGFDGLAHPSDGMLELARKLGRPVSLSEACCSIN